jgi:hypothetical protein
MVDKALEATLIDIMNDNRIVLDSSKAALIGQAFEAAGYIRTHTRAEDLSADVADDMVLPTKYTIITPF